MYVDSYEGAILATSHLERYSILKLSDPKHETSKKITSQTMKYDVRHRDKHLRSVTDNIDNPDVCTCNLPEGNTRERLKTAVSV